MTRKTSLALEASAKQESADTKVAFLIALMLTTSFVSFFYFTSKIVQELSLVALVIPMMMQIRQRKVDWARAKKSFWISTPFLTSLLAAFLFNLDGSEDPLYASALIINLALSFFIFAVIGSHPDRDVWRDVMKILLILALPIFVFVLFTQREAYAFGRWQPYYTGDVTGAHPNWWGLMALGLGWCALAWEKTFVRFVGLAVTAYFMFLLQSRGALVALVVSFIFCSGYFVPMKPRKMGLLLITGILSLAVIALTGGEFIDFIANHVLLLNDPERGSGSGMSGRTEGYAIAWEAVSNNPFFGNGIGVFGFVHNGFLLILAEGGVFALASVLFLFLLSMRRYMKAKHWAGFGYIFSYLVLLMTYPRLLNNNMTSLLVIMVIMRGLCYVYRPTAIEQPRYIYQPKANHE